MKKLYTFIIIAFLTGFVLQAQNLTLSKSAVAVLNGDTIIADGDATVLIQSHVDVKNNGAANLSIKCRRLVIDSVTGSTNSVCWGGQCWPIGISVTPNPTVVNAGTTSSEFSGDYWANTHAGITIIRYTFYDMHATNDSICFIAKYRAWGVGIDELAPQYTISDVYPNPANKSATLNYTVSAVDKSTHIVVSNLLGKEVLSLPVTETEGRIRIETESLSNGLYFYSFILQNKVVFTKKFVVNHN